MSRHGPGRDGYMPDDPPCPVCGSDDWYGCQPPCVPYPEDLELMVAEAVERELRDDLVGYDPHDAVVGFERLVHKW